MPGAPSSARSRVPAVCHTLWAWLLVGALAGCGTRARSDGPPVSSTDSTHPTATLTPPPGDEWGQFLGPTRDSKSREVGILKDWAKQPPRVVWHVELGTGYGICAVAKGRCFQFDRVEDRARLRCLDAATGQTLWSYEYPSAYEDMYGYNNGPRCSPIVDEDRVYVFGAEGEIHCVNAENGSRVWQVDTAEQFGVIQNFFGTGSNPVVHGDLLICMVGGSPPAAKQIRMGQLDQVTGNGSGLVAFDKRTGEARYQVSDELASYAAIQLAEIDGRDWGFAFARGGLIGFQPSTGSIDFHYPWRAKKLESVNAATPIVVGNQVLISETYGPGASLLQVKPGGYDVVWADDAQSRDKAMQTHWNTPVYHEGFLYGSSGRHTNNAELRCIEWSTGKIRWSEPGLSRCSLLYVDGHFICLGEYGELTLLRATPERFAPVSRMVLRDPENGQPLLTYPAWAAPILSHGLLYVRGEGQLVCVELIPQKR